MTIRQLPPAYRGAIVSEGTLRPEDLLESFGSFLKKASPEAYLQVLEAFVEETLRLEDDETRASLIERFDNALNYIAPAGTYFGAHEGDGACFGFWQATDPFEGEDEEDEEYEEYEDKE